MDEGWYDILLIFDLLEIKAKSWLCVAALGFALGRIHLF